MKLLILGATGGTGRQLVTQALERGHEVTVFGRSPQRLASVFPTARLVEGDPRDAAALAAVLPSHSAVLSALGTGHNRPDPLLKLCAASAVEALSACRIPRLVVLSTALCFPELGLVNRLLARFVLSHVVAGSLAMEEAVRSSQLDWTIVRATRLMDGEASGRDSRGLGTFPPGGRAITRADVARVMLEFVERGESVREVVGLGGGR